MTADSLQWFPRLHPHAHRFDLLVLAVAFLAVTAFVFGHWRDDGGRWV